MGSIEVIIDGRTLRVTGIDGDHIEVDGHAVDAEIAKVGHDLFLVQIGRKIRLVHMKEVYPGSYTFGINHQMVRARVETRVHHLLEQFRKLSDEQAGEITVRSPMPGLVTSVEVAAGDEVKPGSGLVVLEAMKMENEIRSHMFGRVKRVQVQPRMSVERNQVLVVIESVSTGKVDG
jgi:biotin carboxyl carrier protein